jgi:hypothetical protein
MQTSACAGFEVLKEMTKWYVRPCSLVEGYYIPSSTVNCSICCYYSYHLTYRIVIFVQCMAILEIIPSLPVVNKYEGDLEIKKYYRMNLDIFSIVALTETLD